MQRIQALLPFSGLSEDCHRELDEIATGRAFRSGSFLVVEGQAADTVHVVTSGAVGITHLHDDGREMTLEILGPGSLVGEMGLFAHSTRSANVEALEATTTVAFPALAFNALMRRRLELALVVAEVLAHRLRLANERIEDLALLDARCRIRSVFRHMAQSIGHEKPDGSVTLPVRLRHNDVARLAAVSRETATKVIGTLMDERSIEVRDSRIVLAPGWQTALRD